MGACAAFHLPNLSSAPRDIAWNKMSVAEFADFERKQGQRIIEGLLPAAGASLVRKPALLQMNPLATALLKRCMPANYAVVRGTAPG
jgi:hypothetical protein